MNAAAWIVWAGCTALNVVISVVVFRRILRSALLIDAVGSVIMLAVFFVLEHLL